MTPPSLAQRPPAADRPGHTEWPRGGARAPPAAGDSVPTGPYPAPPPSDSAPGDVVAWGGEGREGLVCVLKSLEASKKYQLLYEQRA